MKLDLRLPIGLMFTIFGLILALYGLASGGAIYERSLGIDVNLWWGLVLLAFGLVMLTFAIRAGRRRTEGQSTAA
jgi:membrane protein implicated in regulation of membrane protease activity